MKYIKILHTILSVIPLIWLCLLLFILSVGFFHFGYIPEYGNTVDPYALGLDWIYSFEVWLSLFSFISFFVWPLLTITLILVYKNEFVLSKLSVIIFLIGVIGFFIFRYGFAGNFFWVVD